MDEAYLQWLTLIPEIGPERARKIAERFPDFERLKAAYFEELTSIGGIGAGLARRILELVRSAGKGSAEPPSLFLCPVCGSFVARGVEECDFCGARFEGEEPELPGEVESPRLESIILGTSGPVPLCIECGAFLTNGRGCPVCGASYSEDAILRLPLWSPLPPPEPLPLCPRCGAYLEAGRESCAICGAAAAPAVPVEPPTPRGVGRDFLSRWRRISEADVERDVSVETKPPVGPTPPEKEPLPRPMPELSDVSGPAFPGPTEGVGPPEQSPRPVPPAAGPPVSEPIPPAVPPPPTPADALLPSRAEASEIELAIEKYDVLLRADPSLLAAWEIRGDLLGRLGRTREANASYRRALALALGGGEAWRRASEGFRSAAPSPSMPPGVSGRAGRTNGRVNGRGSGRVNGLVNGRVNGLVNGLADRTGAVNGARIPPPTFGGPGRTNGLINGNGLTNGRRGWPPVPPPFSRAHRRRTLIGIAAAVALMLAVPVLASLLTGQPFTTGITIDGEFGDWAAVIAHPDSTSDLTQNDDVNLLEFKVSGDPTYLSAFARVAGTVFRGAGNGSDSLFLLADVDSDALTGYAAGVLGADELVEVYGWDGGVRGANAYRFASADRNNWHGFLADGPAAAALRGDRIEVGYASANPLRARVLLAMGDSFRNLDPADAIVRADAVSLTVDQTWIAPDVIGAAGPALAIDLTPSGGATSVSALNITVRGTAPDTDVMLALYQDNGNGVFDAGDPLLSTTAPMGRVAQFTAPLSLGAPARLFVHASVGPGATGTTLGLAVAEVATPATVSENAERASLAYVGAAPGTVTIDGAFGDWASVPRGVDAIGDVTNRTGGAQVQNENVDLSSIGSVSDGVTASFFLAVTGRMLGGADIPNLRVRHAAPAPDADTDRDTVPDRIELNLSNPNLRVDFDNDNVTDATQLCDVDQDGVRDYGCVGGSDTWLNTTIPAWYPALYAGRTVSVYIGPIAPSTLAPMDAMYVYVDADNDSATGFRMFVGPSAYGADYALAVAGRGGAIESSGLYVYNATSAVPFTYLDLAGSAVDATRLEVQTSVAAMSLGPDYRAIYYAADWALSYDIGLPAPPARVPALRLLSIAGDRPVINEVLVRPNPEWVELANPSPFSFNLQGWSLALLRPNGRLVVIYTFGSVTIGPWGSGSEYVAVTLPADSLPNGDRTLILLDSASVVVDRTMYTTIPSGSTWARFKDPITGKPMDSDSDAADFYVSSSPTRGGPNDRHRPVISVAKTASGSTAEPGDLITYTVYYNNTGTGRANFAWVNDTLPAGVTFVGSSVPPSSIVGSTYSWTFTDVAPTSTNLLMITVEVGLVPDLTLLSNTVTLAYTDQLSRPMSGSQAWANATVVRPVVVVSKVASTSNALPGDIVTYTIYYNNTGSTDAYNVVITDTLPSNVTFLSSSIPPSSVSGRTYVFDVGTVAPGPHSFTVTVQIDVNATGSILVNWAFLNYTTASGFALEASASSASIAIPEFGEVAPLALIATLGLVLAHRRATKRTRAARTPKKEGVADSVPDIGGR